MNHHDQSSIQHNQQDARSHHMKRVATFAEYFPRNCVISHYRGSGWTRRVLTQRAVIARKLAGWTGSIELDAADTTDFILRHIPMPSSDGVPFFKRDLHRAGDCREDARAKRKDAVLSAATRR